MEMQDRRVSEGEVVSDDEDRYVSDEGGEDDGEFKRGEEELDKDDRNFVESFVGTEFGSKTTRILNVLLKSAYIDPNFREDVQFSNLNQTLTLMHKLRSNGRF